ncbi:MAG TPA: HEAT repeat domain-containing protein, partial [Lacipirellulaceae bacterium]|nr:HEAT repeat domain-containing protein [Lacipirellulaceae bacterium]
AFELTQNPSPKWYNDGYEYLASKQAPNGSWSGYCGPSCDTAFSILFLLRSTQKSIHAKLGEGTLLAGRGLPTNLSRAKLHNGELIVEQVHTKVDQLLSMIDDGEEAKLDDLARDPSQLVVDQVDEKSARRLQQLVHGGEPEVRLLAVRALGRTGNLDYVPSLLYAMTDPDRRIVLEARNELRFISRNFDGPGPPDEYTEDERYQALDSWKKWYLSIRPNAVLEK